MFSFWRFKSDDGRFTTVVTITTNSNGQIHAHHVNIDQSRQIRWSYHFLLSDVVAIHLDRVSIISFHVNPESYYNSPSRPYPPTINYYKAHPCCRPADVGYLHPLAWGLRRPKNVWPHTFLAGLSAGQKM